jgi:hypothetical protein
MSDAPEDWAAKVLAESLAACIEQLHHVRARVALLDDGSTASEDDIALLRTLDGVEELLTRLSETMTTWH